MKQSVCICGPVRNCAPYLDALFKNIESIGSLFEEYHILFFYDVSTDASLAKLYQFKKRNPRVHIVCQPPNKRLSPFRTHRIAYARNSLLHIIRDKYPDVPYFIMMDCDDVNVKPVHPERLLPYLQRQDWDALSFQTTPAYYDIWALSIAPFCFSYNHFNNNTKYYHILQSYVTKKLKRLPPDGLLTCISAFNGFALYRSSVFLSCNYDGRVRLDIVPRYALRMHSRATRSPIVFPDYGHVKARYEDCEHRAFHWQAIRRQNARICIAPVVLFGS